MSIKAGILWSSSKKHTADPSSVGLLQLAVPFLLESLLRCTVGLVNVAFLSRISASAVNAVSVSNQYIIVCQTVATAVATGTMVCMNQAIGMKNRAKMNCLASIAFFSNLILGLISGALFLCFSDVFLRLMNLEEVSILFARRYMQIAGGFMAIQCMEIVLCNLARSMGRTHAPFFINLLINAVNILLCYLVIFQPLPIPVDPVVGIAVASVISRLAGLLLAAGIVGKTGLRISMRNLLPFPAAEVKLALQIGIPGGLNHLAYSFSQLLTTSVISLAGELMVTTKIYVTNLAQYIALVGMAFAHSSALMVGYRIGAGKIDEAKAICRRVLRIALLSNAVFSVLLILLRFPLLHIFTETEEIIQIASIVLLIDFVVELGRAMNNCLSGALQAAGDVTYQFLVNQGSGWMVAVGGSYLLGILFGWELYGVWIAFALDELVRGFILLRRWRSDRWIAGAEKRRKIIAR